MSFEFNPDEVLQMAEQIERNGARFYRMAADLVEGGGANELLRKLADWEEDHGRIFADIRAQLRQPERQATVFDPDREAALYLRAMADGHVFDVRIEPADLLTGREEVEEILRLAIGQEKDSIIFYLGLKEIIPEKMGRERIDEIIKEEMRHIAYLNKEMATKRSELNR
jgi:rubrerythrin